MHRSIQITKAIKSLFSNVRQRTDQIIPQRTSQAHSPPLVILNEVKDLVSFRNRLSRPIRPQLSS